MCPSIKCSDWSDRGPETLKAFVSQRWIVVHHPRFLTPGWCGAPRAAPRCVMAVTMDTATWAGAMGQCAAPMDSGRSQSCSAKVPCPLTPFTCPAGGQVLPGPWSWFWYHQVTSWCLVPLQRLPVGVLLSWKPLGGCGMAAPAPAALPFICARRVLMRLEVRTNQCVVRTLSGQVPRCHVEVIQQIHQ